MEDISINFETRVSSYLNFLISVNETRTYSEIADKCDIKPPGKIRKISRILLKIAENDIIDNFFPLIFIHFGQNPSKTRNPQKILIPGKS